MLSLRGWHKFLSRAPRSRLYSTSTLPDASKIRNIALVAHIDSGKTTLTESILLKSSYLSASGSVDTGSTTTDFLPVERERGITVQSASIPVKWKDWTFNLIDTPGHADFGMEVESASRIVDGAVVLIDSVEGVESQTRGVWKQLNRYGVATRLMFLNKLDRPGASLKKSLMSLLAHRLHPQPMVLTLPIASFDPRKYDLGEPGIEGLVDLVKWEMWKWDQDGKVSRISLPTSVEELSATGVLPASHPLIPHLLPARTQLLESLSMFSENLMELLLSLPAGPSAYLGVDSSAIMPELRKASLRNEVLPILCGSAAKNIGTDIVMDYVGELLASPLDVPHDPQEKNAPLRVLAWKVNWDKRRGWMTFVRVYSGKITRHSALLNTNQNKKEKVSKLLLLYASEVQEVDELPFGSVGVIVGLKYTRTGDTLVSAGAPATSRSVMRDITPPPALISASVIPQSHSDLDPVLHALESLSRTDPSVRVDMHEGQILLHGLGGLHLEIVEGRLRDEWGVQFEFGKRRVSYREGLGPDLPANGWDTWNTEIGGKPVSVTIPMSVRSLMDDEKGDPNWDGNVLLDWDNKRLSPADALSGTPIAYVCEGIASALSNSPHSSLPLTCVVVQLEGPPTAVAAPLILTGAAATILRDRIRQAGLGHIKEPYALLKVSVTESALGKVVKDLTEHSGEVLDLSTGSGTGTNGAEEETEGYSEEGIYIPPAWISPSGPGLASMASSSSGAKRSIRALVPMSRFLDYSSRLRALSEGHGTFELVSAGFKDVSETRRLEIMQEIGRT